MAQRFVLMVAAVLALSAFGCGRQYGNEEPPDDEAMIWAKYDRKTPEEAARDYFYPKKIEDYFSQMDSVGGRAREAEDWPDQLLDRPPARPARDAEPLALSEREVLGRNTWLLWCGGNERFWDWLASNSFGFADFLKLLDSRNRSTRFRDAGLINEPGMTAAGAPQEDEFGLWLDLPADQRVLEWRKRYARSTFDQIGRREHKTQRGREGYGGRPDAQVGGGYEAGYEYAYGIPPPDIYGLSSGVVGLRLFPNPNFDDQARKKWDANRYYNEPAYYNDPNLVRPYRVGMSCAFCHVSFHPLKPPRDVTNPGWENISGNIGAQYLRIRAVFGNLLSKDSFVYHVLDSQPPGTIDTSLIPSDNINNTNAMNSVFNLRQRVLVSFRNPSETLSATSASQPSVWGNPREVLADDAKPYGRTDQSKYPRPRSLAEDKVPQAYWKAFEANGLLPLLRESNDNPRHVPRILFDGADSVGAWVALARVYLNIGTYSEQWERLHKPLVGFQPQRPFKIDDCESHSVYWHATQLRVGPMRDYFLRITPPMRLLDADGGGAERAWNSEEKPDRKPSAAEKAKGIDVSKLRRGRKVFARNCIVCHSSIQPPERHQEMATWAAKGEPWDHDPGKWLHNDAYLKWAEAAVEDDKFWRENYLSTDYRIPVNLVRTNSARAMATNAMSRHMWEDFSSASYQRMPSVGPISYYNPYRGANGGEDRFLPRHAAPAGVPDGGGGPGFYRVPTLVSIWATAPLLHNNSLGLFNNDPSVNGRLAAFDDAIRKLLWPEKRLESSSYNEATAERLKADHGLIWRTPQETYLQLSGKYVPAVVSRVPALSGFREWSAKFMRERLGWLPLWLPTAGLLVIAFFVLIFASKRLTRNLGYLSVIGGLGLGALLYFVNGELGDVRIGPIPKGTPVNLLANINPEAEPGELKKAVKRTLGALAEIESKHLSESEARKLMQEKIAPELMKVSKCPDFVMDQGHYFEWFKTMTDEDKEALIELLKTF